MKVAPQAGGGQGGGPGRRARAEGQGGGPGGRASGIAVSLIPCGYGWGMPAFGISLKRDASAHSCPGISYDLSAGGRRCKAIMEFRALGPIELWSAGRQRDLGRARARSVLAILLLTPRAIVPAETLIDRLWDTRPPPKARDSLSVYVARLRASLRQAVGDGVRLVGRAQGYVLDVDPEAVDLHQFRRLRRQADALAASGDYEQAAGLLREADGLWRGQALAGIRGDWVARMRDALEEERRAAILERVGCELELGRHADLVGELRHLLVQYPSDETLVAHQMTALYRSGRPGDALSLYRETRGRLVEEQGTEPGAMLSELHQRILGRDPGLAVRPSGRTPGRGGAARHPSARDGGIRGPRRGTRIADRRARRRPGDHRHRGHAGRGEDRAGRPRGPPGLRAVPGRDALPQPPFPRSREPLARPGRGAAPPAPDDVRAGRADTGNRRRAHRTVAGPPEPPSRRRDPGRRGRA